jgi:hypothetical protein
MVSVAFFKIILSVVMVNVVMLSVVMVNVAMLSIVLVSVDVAIVVAPTYDRKLVFHLVISPTSVARRQFSDESGKTTEHLKSCSLEHYVKAKYRSVLPFLYIPLFQYQDKLLQGWTNFS